MSKPNMYCGECPYWLAFGEPETADEQNEAILAHCKECDFDPDAAEQLYKMFRAARKQIVWRKAIHGEEIR